MREIIFRGKSISDRSWCYGNYIHYKKFHLIYDCNYFESPVSVFPKTVGQYIGVSDCNSTPIFEGDAMGINSIVLGVVEYNPGTRGYMLRTPEGGFIIISPYYEVVCDE